MRKKTIISQQDLDFFHQAMEGVKPLTPKKSRKATLSKKGSSALPKHKRQKTQDHEDIPPLFLSESSYLDPVAGETSLTYKQSGISNKTLRKLTKGQYNVNALLDLHGMSIEEARIAVTRFIQQCLNDGTRIALIIHGKGQPDQMPILKNKLNHWLREINTVLAFCSATPSQGGRGAVYIYLKHQI